MRRSIMFALSLTLLISFCFAQPSIVWQKCLGGSSTDYALSIRQTTDGGSIVAGSSFSNDGDVSGNHGYDDYWVVKLNSVGEIVWQKSLGGSYHDYAYSIRQTTDGGFIIAGWSESNDGDVSGHHGSTDYYDYWVVKLNSAGEIEWQKCLGGSDGDVAWSIHQTSDGGFIVAGHSNSNDGDVSGWHEGYDDIGGNPLPDYWVVKLSPEDGIIENAVMPEQFAINVFPNPFNSSCVIAAPAGAKIEMYDLLGNRLWSKTIPRSAQANLVWAPDESIASGIYLVKAICDGECATRKLVYLK